MPEEPDFLTAYLGKYNEFEAPVVIEILADAGIRAFAKNDLTEPEHSQYAPFFSDAGVVLCDAARVDEARALVEEELPKHLASVREQMQRMELGEFDVEDDDGQ